MNMRNGKCIQSKRDLNHTHPNTSHFQQLLSTVHCVSLSVSMYRLATYVLMADEIVNETEAKASMDQNVSPNLSLTCVRSSNEQRTGR